jgi:hypothetical protein
MAVANYIPPAFGMAANVGPNIPGTTTPAFVSAFGGNSPSIPTLGPDAKPQLNPLPNSNFPTFGHASPLPNNQPLTFAKDAGWKAQWAWHAPPGVGDAPQSVWQTYYLAPVDAMKGPGDLPRSQINTINMNPQIQNFAMRYQGMAVQGGNILLTGLYTPAPITPY